jgi:hypothetical protein
MATGSPYLFVNPQQVLPRSKVAMERQALRDLLG